MPSTGPVLMIGGVASTRWLAGRMPSAREVRRHQAEEDEHAFPALADRVPAAAAILVRLDADHRDFTRVLAELAPAMTGLADPAASFPDAQRVAAVTTARLRDLVAAHVFDEDVNVAPLIERHLSFDEYASQQAAAISRLPLRIAAGFTVPWLLAASSPADRPHVRGLLPTRLAIAGRAGAHQYRRRVAVAFGSE